MSTTELDAPSKSRTWTNDILIALLIVIPSLTAPLLVLRERLGYQCHLKKIDIVNDLLDRILTSNLGTLPLVITIAIVLGLVFARRWEGAKAFFRPALALLISTVPAWISLAQVVAEEERLGNVLVKKAGEAHLDRFWWFSMEPASTMQHELDLVAAGCLKSGVLLLFACALAIKCTKFTLGLGYRHVVLHQPLERLGPG